MPELIVHILSHGYPLCPLAEDYPFPKDWPKGHVWVDLHNKADATCVECRATASKITPHTDYVHE